MNFDAIIVGGGIIGCAHAFYLTQKGLKVALVEAASLGSGTSARNFSWANASTKPSDAAYHHLNALGVRLYGELATQFGAQTLGINPAGALEFARKSRPADYAAKQTKTVRLVDLGYPCHWLDRNALRILEPNIALAKDAEAFITPDEKIVNTVQFIRFLVDQIKQKGGQVFENCKALEILADADGAVVGLSTELGEMATPRLVIAAGPDTPEVLACLTGFDGFHRFPVNKLPGLLLTTPPLAAGLIRHLIHSDGETEVHFLPDFNGGLRIASDEVDGLITNDQSPDNLHKQGIELLRRAKTLLPDALDAVLIDDCKLAVGVRAYPEDGKTIAGPLPGSEGVYVIATHSGVTLAPVVGSLMAELVADGTVPEMLRPFLLDRLEGFG